MPRPTPSSPTAGGLGLACYLLCIVVSPALTALVGYVPVAPGLSAPAGTAVSAVTVWARGTALDAYGRRAVASLWLPGSVLAVLLAPAQLVIATVVAFLLTEPHCRGLAAAPPAREADRGGSGGVTGLGIDVLTYVCIAGMPLAAATAGKLAAKLWITGTLALITVTWRFSARRLTASGRRASAGI